MWLHAVPATHAGLSNTHSIYIGMLMRWLRLPFVEKESVCGFCDGWLDSYGDHALTCCGGGDRTRRHNLIRNAVFHSAAAANLCPELEKPGLLPQRPSAGSCYENGSSHGPRDGESGYRRPADVFLPRWQGGPPAALDFAITSGLRPDSLAASVFDRQLVCSKYEDFKCSFKDTKTECLSQCFAFHHMVMEAVQASLAKQLNQKAILGLVSRSRWCPAM